MNHEQAIRSIWVDVPRFTEPIVNTWRSTTNCHCEHCDQLRSWLAVPDSIRQISLFHVDSLINLAASSDRDDCLDWLQLLMKRSGRSLQQAEIPIRSRWLLEQEHARLRNWVDDRRLLLWFTNSLSITVGMQHASRAISLWYEKFNFGPYLETFDDFDGLPFHRAMRCRVSLAASDFYLDHHEEIAAWGRG